MAKREKRATRPKQVPPSQMVSVSTVIEAAIAAGTIDGACQTLEQCARHLEDQAKQWRTQAASQLAKAWGPFDLLRARVLVAQTESFAERMDRTAAAIRQQATQRAPELKAQKRRLDGQLAAYEQTRGRAD